MSAPVHVPCLAGLSLAALFACKSTNPYPANTPIIGPTESAPATAAPSPKGEVPSERAGIPSAAERGVAGSRGTPATSQAGKALSDEEIAAITAAANNAEVDQGNLARAKAHDPRVRDFGAMMIEHHDEARQEQQSLNIPEAESVDSRELTREANSSFQKLQHEQGSDFDRAYVQVQIDEHKKVLQSLQHELLPAARNPKLKAYLEKMTPTVESHLAQAERLQQELSSPSEPSTRSGAGSY